MYENNQKYVVTIETPAVHHAGDKLRKKKKKTADTTLSVAGIATGNCAMLSASR